MPKRKLYVVETNHNAEASVHHRLSSVFYVICPTIRTGRKQALMFPHYLFVVLDLNIDPWRRISRTVGVKSMLFGERPQPLHEREAETIRSIANEPLPPDEALIIKQGMIAAVERGPFVGYSGVCKESDDAAASLLIHILGRDMSLPFPHEDLRRIDGLSPRQAETR